MTDFSLAGSNFKEVIWEILKIIDILNPILFILAFIVFFWGLSKFILSSGSEANIKKGKDYMLWGILALFILLTFRAIITLVAGDLGIGDTHIIPILPTGDSEVKNPGFQPSLKSNQIINLPN